MSKEIEIIHYAVALIDPSPYQVREHFAQESLQELAESIKEHGIIQPLTARVSPKDPARLELVAGERRWRAASLAGLDTVPVIVRELTDLAAQEIVLIENLQREDLTVSEEARGYQKALSLVGPDGQPIYSQQALAAKIGKPVTHLRDRLKLLLCPEELVKAVEAHEVSLSTAMLVGRIPDSKLRQQAARQVLKPETQEVPLNYEQTQEMIRESFMVSLQKPGFDVEDADLVPEVKDEDGTRVMGGSCVGCPYCQQLDASARNSAPGKEVNIKHRLCTLPPCFRKKQDAAWKIMRSRAEEQNLKVIDGDAARELFSNGGRLRYGSDYVQLDEKPEYDDVGMKCYDNEKKWRSLLKGSDVEVVIARNPVTGQRVELAHRKEAKVIAKAKLNNTSADVEIKNAEQAQAAQRESRKEELREQKIEKIVLNEGLTDLAEAIGRKGMDADQLSYLFQVTLENSGADGFKIIKDWLELKMPKGTAASARDYEEDILKVIGERAATPQQWLGYIVVATLAKCLRFNGPDDDDLVHFWKLYGIKKSQLERRAEAILDAGKKPGKKASPSPEAAETQNPEANAKCPPVDEDLLARCREWKLKNPGLGAGAMADEFSMPMEQAYEICDRLVDEKHDAVAEVKQAEFTQAQEQERSSFDEQVKAVANGVSPSEFIGLKPSPKKEPEAYKEWSARRMKLVRAAKKLQPAA